MTERVQPLVLLIAEDPEIRRTLQETLEAGAFRVVPAGTGAEGMRLLREVHPDLLLLDCNLDARQLCRALKEDPSTRLTPVVVIGATGEPEEYVRFLEDGADEVLPRDCEPAVFAARVLALSRIKSCYDDLAAEVRALTDIGISLSAERNLARLLDLIVTEARGMTNADGGSLYTVDSEARLLHFRIIQNETLGTRIGGEHGQVPWPPLPLDPSIAAGYAALTGEVVNIPDVYEAEGFDFSGFRRVDAQNNYRSRSMLMVPIRNHENQVIGVLQLINATDPESGAVVPFHESVVERARALASQAGVALTNAQLIHDLEAFVDGLINVMADAIDEKSRYTSGHIQRVTQYAGFLAEAVNACPDERFDGRRFSEEELEELRVAGLLHDTGKIVIPEHVVDKATKLQTVYDRIGVVRTRFSVIRRGMENAALRRKLELVATGAHADALAAVEAELREALDTLAEDLEFLESINRGGEYLADEKLARLQAIARRTYVEDDGTVQPYLTEEEVRNLSIPRGTLLLEEIQIIRNHAAVSQRLLSRIPFPHKLRNVPVYAGDHHEMLDGSGYPNRKAAGDLPLQSRILAVADIFDALTASDRPYKSAFSIERACEILRADAAKGKLDSRLVELFIESGCCSRLKTASPEAVSEAEAAPA